jgi:hypothetical protein
MRKGFFFEIQNQKTFLIFGVVAVCYVVLAGWANGAYRAKEDSRLRGNDGVDGLEL